MPLLLLLAFFYFFFKCFSFFFFFLLERCSRCLTASLISGCRQLGGDASWGGGSWSQRFGAEAEQVGARNKAKVFVGEM